MMIYWGIIGIYIYNIDMTVIELRHNSYIGQKKEFWRCARRGMPQLVSGIPILSNTYQLVQDFTTIHSYGSHGPAR